MNWYPLDHWAAQVLEFLEQPRRLGIRMGREGPTILSEVVSYDVAWTGYIGVTDTNW